MIQRIQTVYLLLVALLMALAFFLPTAYFTTEAGTAVFRFYELTGADGVAMKIPSYLMFLSILALALPLYIIFRFKNRLHQIRFCVVEMILLVGVLLVAALYIYRLFTLFSETYEAFALEIRWPMLCPLVALLFSYLAMRAVFRDEMLVRAADRIR